MTQKKIQVLIFLCFLFACNKPTNFDEVFIDKRWRQATEEKIESIEKNNTWELTTLFKDHLDDWMYIQGEENFPW